MNNTTRKVTVQEVKNHRINPADEVRVEYLGERHAAVLHMSKPVTQQIKRLDKLTYEVIATGEIRYYEHNNKKMPNNMRKVFRRLSNLIRANFDTVGNRKNALFITLTYTDNMTDADRLYDDFKVFIQRVRRAYPAHNLDYIVVAEPQERGAWHLHLMLKSDQPTLYIPNTDEQGRMLDKLWGRGEDGKGNAQVARLKSDDVGAYYTTYFHSREVPADRTAPAAATATDTQGKKYQKGARLPMYPKNFKFYRCSKGIIRPKAVTAKYGDIVAQYGQPTQSYSCELILEPDEMTPEQEADIFTAQLAEGMDAMDAVDFTRAQARAKSKPAKSLNTITRANFKRRSAPL